MRKGGALALPAEVGWLPLGFCYHSQLLPGTYSQEWLLLCILDLLDDFPPSCWQSHHRPLAALPVVGAQEMFVELRGSHSLCRVWIIHQIIHQPWPQGRGGNRD